MNKIVTIGTIFILILSLINFSAIALKNSITSESRFSRRRSCPRSASFFLVFNRNSSIRVVFVPGRILLLISCHFKNVYILHRIALLDYPENVNVRALITVTTTQITSHSRMYAFILLGLSLI